MEKDKLFENMHREEAQANKIIYSDSYSNSWATNKEVNEIFEVNSYWRRKITSLEKRSIHDNIANAFCDSLWSKWYTQEKSVSINSGIDDSVYFIGAPTSVLKPYLLHQTIPHKGVFLQQPSFRTHNAKRLRDDAPIRRWSTFTWIACISNYDDGESLLKDSIDFLLNTLRIPLQNIAIHISSKDHDLQKLLDSVGNPISLVFDTKDPVYYTHKYWLWDIVWRNLNFVLKDEKTGSFNMVGNYIIIEDQTKKYWIESWFWTSVIMKELYGLDHVLDTSIISDLVPWDSVAHRKLQDAIVVSFLMCDLGVLPKRHETKWRIFKRYLSGIEYNQEQLGMTFDELERVLKQYEKMEYDSCVYSDFILSQLETK